MTAATANMKWQEFRARLEKSLPGRCFLFLGEEEADKADAVDMCAKLFMGEGTPDTVRMYNAATDSLEEIASFVLQDSMFSPARVCLVQNIDSVTATKKKEAALLQEMVAQLPDSALLIMSSNDKSLPASLKPVSVRVQQVVFWPMFEERLQQHIMDRCRKAGMRISPAAAKMLVDAVGRNRAAADEVLDMALLAGAGEFGEKDVEQWIGSRKKIPAWELAPAVFSSDPGSLKMLHALLDDGAHELQLLKMMFNELERMESFLDLRRQGIPVSDALGRLKINSRAADGFVHRAQHFSEERIRRGYVAIYEAECALKGVTQPPVNPMEILIQKLVLR